MRKVLAVALIAAALASREASGNELAEARACERLLRVAKTEHLAVENSVGVYRSESYMNAKRYFVFQLHYAGGEPKGWAGSTLAGYYAVRKGDQAVLRWDFGNDAAGKIIAR